MATKIIDNNGILCFDSISSEDDLKLRPRKNINSPPTFRRCNCCGKHISKLKPFGKAGDPMVGDFEGALRIKKHRPAGPYIEEVERAWDEAEKHLADAAHEDEDPLEWMIKKYGKEKGEYFYWSVQASSQVGSSWECRDCAGLDTNEFFLKKIIFKGLSEEGLITGENSKRD